MDRRAFLQALGLLLLARPCPAGAQSEKPLVGFLSANSRAAMSARVDAFRTGLRELGYVDRENLSIEYRFADGRPDQLRALAAELVDLKVRVIVTEGTTATRFAKEATTTVPIVMAQDPDPVGTGLVASLARPGGNITGLSNLRPELSGKRLQLLKDTVPRLTRVAVLATAATPGTAQTVKETELAAAAVGVQLQYVEVAAAKDIDIAFRNASSGRADAALVLASPILLSHRSQVTDLALKNRLPTMYYTTEFVHGGGLISYGVSALDLFRRAASYVDKILKGAKPGELPIEQPTKFEFAINLKTAKALGLAIPPSLLQRADQVIE